MVYVASRLTIYGQVAESCGGCSLDFDIRAIQEEEDGFESSTVNRAYICSQVSAQNFRVCCNMSHLFR